MPGLNYGTEQGEVVITSESDGDVSMMGPAFCILDPLALWSWLEVVGENEALPGYPGTQANPWQIDEAQHNLWLAIGWECEQDGSLHATAGRTPWQGVQHTIDYLKAQILAPVTAYPYARASTMTMPSGEERTASVQPRRLKLGAANAIGKPGGHILATLELWIPAGEYV